MADYLDIKYPDALTTKAWDKAKSTLAKKHKTGLGEALKALEKMHSDIQWKDNYKFAHGSLKQQDQHIAEWPAYFKANLKPLVDKAGEVKTIALKAAEIYKKDKLIPSSTAKAAEALAKEAQSYKTELEDAEGLYVVEMNKARAQYRQNVRNLLMPMVTKGIAKCDALFSDIKSYAGNPTKENFFSIFSGDCAARGYCTQLKNMDQFLTEFPDIREQVWPSSFSLVKELLPGMAGYGANWAEAEFEKHVNKPLGITESDPDTWKVHARLLLKQSTFIRKFQADLIKLQKLL